MFFLRRLRKSHQRLRKHVANRSKGILLKEKGRDGRGETIVWQDHMDTMMGTKPYVTVEAVCTINVLLRFCNVSWTLFVVDEIVC